MNETDFAAIFKFFETTAPDVAGRCADPISEEADHLISHLQSGNATPSDKGRLATLLKENPEWVAAFVRRIRPAEAEES